ncbi:MAG TPA: hypothetical protein VGO24_09245 [Solirubrobacterales bacterium]|jgi:hypothetical protein|nr:hypothetical protein [Solirubrobacterales bacterium]
MQTIGMGIKSMALGGLVAALLLGAPFASGAEQTRESYTAQVEPICKSNTEASGRILKGVKGIVRAGKLTVAGAKFTKAAQALKKTLNQLRAVPPPTADKARLEKWLGYIKEEVELLERTAQKLKAGNKTGAQEMAVRLTYTANRANNQVLSFEFKYCRANPSQFAG